MSLNPNTIKIYLSSFNCFCFYFSILIAFHLHLSCLLAFTFVWDGWLKLKLLRNYFVGLNPSHGYCTVDSHYLDPSYLDPITYVELISKSRLFSLCIYCISASRMSNYFCVDTSAISSIIFSPWTYFSQFLLPRISNSDHDDGKQNVRCGAACLSVNENHNRPLINKSIV